MIKNSGKLYSSTIVTVLSSYLRVKFYAIFLGAYGLGVISQLNNFSSLLTFFITLGLPLGITKLISENETDDEKTNSVFSAAILIMFCGFIFSSLIIYLFSDYISVILFESSSFSPFLLLLILTIPFSSFLSIVDSIFKGQKRVGLVTRITIISTLISLVVNLLLIYTLKIEGAIYGIILSSVISGIVYFKYYKKANIKFKFRFNSALSKTLLTIGAASLAAGIIQQLSLLLCRLITISSFGITGNGLLQSIIGLSNNYFSFIFLTLASYSFPKIASLKTDELVNVEINRNLRFVTFIMIPLVILVFAFKDLLILILYTKDFSVIADFLKYQLIGDFFKALGWVFGLWLIPKNRLKVWLGIELVFNVNLIFIYYILIHYVYNDLICFSVSYLFSCLIHFLINFFLTKKYLKFSVTRDNFLLLMYSLSLLSVSFLYLLILRNYSPLYLLLLCIVWFYYSLSKEEKIFVGNKITGFINK